MTFFDHEKLRVYQEAICFVAWTEGLISQGLSRGSVLDQLDRASTSIPLNIAEGNGRFTGRDRCRFFDIARASALECAACLDVIVAKGRITEEQAVEWEAEASRDRFDAGAADQEYVG